MWQPDWPAFRQLQSGLSALAVAVAFIFGIIGTSAAIVIPFFNPSVQSNIATWTICVMFSLFLLWSVYREYKIARKEKYANISNILQSISMRVQDLSFYLLRSIDDRGNSPEELIVTVTERLGVILDDVVGLFSMLTGTHCRAAIKVVNSDGSRVWAHALTRDQRSAQQNAQSDKDRNNRQYDIIGDNEDFDLLFDPKRDDRGYYFNNNLSARPYRSTSISYRREQAGSHAWNPSDEEKWVLDYRSAIVWPIRRLPNRSGEERLCYGFLAVDSESRNVFERRWDTSIGASIAHQLFIPLFLYFELEGRIRSERLAEQEHAA